MRESVRDAYNYQGYSGTMAEDDGLTIEVTKVFTNEAAAADYISENTEKWGPSLAVLIRIRANKNKGIAGERYWIIGGHYSC